MILGLVSNCWRIQLARGESLESLIARAVELGWAAIELRQTCLGDFESAEHLPDAARLKTLPERFPRARFNIAVCVPFMNPAMAADEVVFNAGQLAAAAVAGKHEPHLRLVDLMTGDEQLEGTSISAVGESIARLAGSCIDRGLRLSIEHSRQSWRYFRAVFDAARHRLGSNADQLRICFDPCNLLLPADGSDPARITASLADDELSMIHFKQRRANRACPAVMDGQVDWPAVVTQIKEKGFACPGLLEIDSSDDVWASLAASRKFLASVGLET